MDDVFSKIKRKLVKQEPEVISPSEREQRLRQMLGYDQSERKAIDPGFAADIPDSSNDDEFGIKGPLDLEPQRPIPGKPDQVDMMARYKKKKTPIEQAREDAASRQRKAALAIDPTKSGSSNPRSLERITQQEMDDEFYRQAELLRKQREAMKTPASGLSNLVDQAKKLK
jgi:hypothetical protein